MNYRTETQRCIEQSVTPRGNYIDVINNAWEESSLPREGEFYLQGRLLLMDYEERKIDEETWTRINHMMRIIGDDLKQRYVPINQVITNPLALDVYLREMEWREEYANSSRKPSLTTEVTPNGLIIDIEKVRELEEWYRKTQTACYRFG